MLEDLEGVGAEEEVAIKIRNRFLVARLLRGLLEDHLVVDEDSLSHQVRGVLKEIAHEGQGSGEARVWQRILAAVQKREYVELVAAILEWGRMVDAEGHFNGALEILELAFELARTSGASEAAADAARFQGKVYRSRAQWDHALFWYGVARRISEESGNRKRLAMVLDGLGNAYRDLGNLPRARETLLEVLEIGRRTGDRSVLAVGHHDLMTVEKLRGNLVEAIHQGWLAVQAYDSRDGRLRALFDLASTLREGGELSAARDAYGLVAEQVKGMEARILALDALAFLAALRGDGEEHATLRERMDAEGWETVSPVYRGQILYYRGLSHRALGQEAVARLWLERALAYAGDHDLNKLIFDAEAALAEDRPGRPEELVPAGYEDLVPEEILGVRRGLRAMKEAPAGLG